MSVKESYAQKPQLWNLSIVISVGGILWLLSGLYLDNQIVSHNIDKESHADIRAEIASNDEQLTRIEANQIQEQAIQMDARLCDDPNNRVYRERLSDLNNGS